MVQTAEQREKNQVTVISVVAAIALTVLKLVVGLLTGSLGLISDAAHSGLDTVSTVITFFSVRVAGRPADREHPYGHGRVENLSAIIQGVLLAGTAAFIIYESFERIFFHPVEVEASIWAFAVMATSIIVDFWRSRTLLAAARKYHSKALEADALNFRADMFSSSVVILGLALVAYAEATGQSGWLTKADSVAALIIGLVIIYISGRLAFQAVNVLLDRAPSGLQERMAQAISAVPGVIELRQVRVRESGHRVLADVTAAVPRTASAAQAHSVTEQVEAAVRSVEPRTEVVVHVETAASETETAAEGIRAAALKLGIQTHHEQVYIVGDHLEAALHVEVPPQMTLGEGHDLAQGLAQALKRENPRIQRVDTHIEVAEPHASRRRDASGSMPQLIDEVKRVVRETGVDASCHEVRVYTSDVSDGSDGWDIVLHCDMPVDLPMGKVHRRTERIEQQLRERFPELERVVIHAEPRDSTARIAERHGHLLQDGTRDA
jgi:cation diffusion facilitator family transporter